MKQVLLDQLRENSTLWQTYLQLRNVFQFMGLFGIILLSLNTSEQLKKDKLMCTLA